MENRCRECGKPLVYPKSMGHNEYHAQRYTGVCVACRDRIAEQVREAKRAWYGDKLRRDAGHGRDEWI